MCSNIAAHELISVALSRFVSFYRKDILRAGFYADAAGNTLAWRRRVFRLDHHLKGAGLHAFSAVFTLRLVYHVNAGFILRNSAVLAGFGALAALNTGKNLDVTVFRSYAHTCQRLFKYVLVFVKRQSAGVFAGKTDHAGVNVAYYQFFHSFSPTQYRIKPLCFKAA
jgi:hypothetical protein